MLHVLKWMLLVLNRMLGVLMNEKGDEMMMKKV